MPGEYAQSWLDWEAMSGGRAALHGSPEEIRAAYVGLVQALAPMSPPFTENVDFKDADIEGVKVRIYTPKGVSGLLPVVSVSRWYWLPIQLLILAKAIWTHSGGYMVGDLDGEHSACGAISEHTKSAVINVDYRLAPEHKWPAQLDDCMTVYRWVCLDHSRPIRICF